MKTRTTAFDTAWANRRVRKAFYYVTLKRRYFNGSAYVLESAPTTISRREIDKIGGLSSKFDTPLQNRILPSSASITLLNKSYKWLPSNTANGKWRPDAASSLGYDPVGSEFAIYYALVLADGTTEAIAQFTGVVQDDPTFDSISGTVTFSLMEKSAALLQSARAQNVGTFVDNGTTDPANGDGVVDTFSTQKKSLWRVHDGQGGTQAVRVNGVAQVQGTDYELDDLNDAEVEAKIRFLAGHIPGAFAVLFDGDHWYRDKSISQLVGLLCDEAGIASGDREIEEPIFSAVDQSQTISSLADWALWTLTNGEATSQPGYLRRKWHKVDDFSDTDLNSNPAWNLFGLTAAVSAGKLSVTSISDGVGTQGGMSCALPKTSGTWQFKAKYNSGSFDFNFIFSGTGSGGYALLWRPNPADPAGGTAQLARWPSLAALGSSFALSGTDEKTIRITRTAAGEINVYVDEGGGLTLKATATDTTYTTGTQFVLYFQRLTSTLVMDATIDDIYFSDVVDATNAVETGDMVAESAEIDLLAAPSNFLPILFAAAANGGTYSIRTKGSVTSGGVYEAYVASDVTYTPQSSLRRYLKVELTATDGSFLQSPVFDSLRIGWRGSSLFIQSADFTGLSCQEAVQELATIGGMEFGSRGDGTFFFKNRSVSGAADLVLSQKNAIISASRGTSGFKDVKTIGVVRYGNSGSDGYYYAEYGAAQSGESSPTNEQRFGAIPVELELNRFIFSNDAQVAVAVARKLYEINYRPKRKLTLRTRIIPHLETRDKLSISIHDSPLIEKTIYGDPFQKSPPLGPNTKTLARSILMKVVGLTQDIMKSESSIELEEVLS